MDDLEARSIGNRNKLLVEAIMANVEQMMDRKVDAFRQEFQRHSGREPSSARQSKEQELNPKHVLNMKMEAKLTTQPKEVTTSIDSRREKSVDKKTDHGKETSLNNSDKMMTEALTAHMEPIMLKEVDVFRPKQSALGTEQNTRFRAVLKRTQRTEKKRKNKRFKPPDLDQDLRSNPFQEGEDDMILDSNVIIGQGTKEVPATPAGPMTRSRTKKLRHDIGPLLHSAKAQEDHSDLTCFKATLAMMHAREG